MKFDTLKNLTLSELYQNAVNLKKESLNIRILASTSQETNPNRLRQIRRDIAQIKTRIQQLKKSA